MTTTTNDLIRKDDWTTRARTELQTPIVEAKRTTLPRYGMLASGYTCRRGAPTSVKIRREGERCWRRLMIWQFSNASTLFVRCAGSAFIVHAHNIPGWSEL